MDMQLRQILMENSGTFLLGYRQRNQGREEPKALGRAGQGRGCSWAVMGSRVVLASAT